MNRLVAAFFFLFLLLSIFGCTNTNTTTYYRIQDKGLYGYIDSLGNVMIEPQYKYSSGFTPDGFAYVITQAKIVDGNFTINYGYINKENKIIVDTVQELSIPLIDLQTYWKISPESLEENVNSFNSGDLDFEFGWLRELYPSNNIYIYQDNDSKLIGYKNFNGEIIIQPSYIYAGSLKYDVAFVSKGINADFTKSISDNLNVYSLINSKGEIIKENEWSYIAPFDENKKTWCAEVVAEIEGDNVLMACSWTQVDINGKICIGPVPGLMGSHIYNNSFKDNCDLYIYQFPDMFGINIGYSFINKDGRFATDYDKNNEINMWGEDSEVFQDVTSFSDGVAGIKVYVNGDEDSSWIFVNSDFEMQNYEQYDSIKPFNNGLAAVEERTKPYKHMGDWGYINRDFELVIPYKFSKVGYFDKGLAYAAIKGPKYFREGYINKEGEFVWETKRNLNP